MLESRDIFKNLTAVKTDSLKPLKSNRVGILPFPSQAHLFAPALTCLLKREIISFVYILLCGQLSKLICG